MRAEIPERPRAAITLTSGTGLRRGEALGLSVDGVDLLRRQLTIDRKLLKVTGSAGAFGPLKTRASVQDRCASGWHDHLANGILEWVMSGKTRRRTNIGFVYAVAFLMIATAGPSLVLSNLVLHTVLGVSLVAATLGHIWLNRHRAIGWPASGRLRRWPSTGRGWLLKGQDALRELFFIATLVSGVVLMAGGPGLDLHATVGFTVFSLAVIHAGLHRSWFAARCAKRRRSPN